MEYLLHLAKDKRLKKLIDGHQPLTVERRKDVLFYLVASIMSQQLSTKVADSIKQKFLTLYDGRIPSPQEILDTPPETLRSIGLSNAKVSYVQNVARFAIEKGLDPDVLHEMDNEEVIAYLTEIKGVGRWTVEMLLMFALGREDVFAIDDWGVQNAMLHIYQLDRTDKKAFREALLTISQKWSPYRTYACMHLWRWKDNSPLVKTPAKKAAPKKKVAAKKIAPKKGTATKKKAPAAKTPAKKRSTSRKKK
jgi:DNA-3-methyladenine glycosylase II